ncbi:Protein-L-isoaspartate O-methyltransferase [Commensalibacter sp. Nvir]|uniref:protein-L-isoaspartate O-methyltransferase family protein n=1 Tax=Commensalibacter sp. Nvir TaxID=3069817 RepID=UPI002D5989FE|nr:Protein-L-isoaspartate O-methyltransferase [Commensalibacter sp. Nvir]
MNFSSSYYQQFRQNMVENQLRPAGVNHRQLIEIMRVLPREQCVEPLYQDMAYADMSLPLGKNRVFTEPRVMARMIQLAEIKLDQKIMILGGSTGYLASVLSLLGSQVISVEEDEDLLAKGKLFCLDYALNVVWHHGSFSQGCPQHSMYDSILIDGAIREVPEEISEQLLVNGCIISVVNEAGRAPAVARFEKTINGLTKRYSFYADLPILGDF